MAFVNLHQKPKHHGKQVAGVAAGAALLGAAGAVLLTPKSGKEVRGDIAKGSKAAADQVGKTVKAMEKRLNGQAKKTTRKAPAATKTAATRAKTTAARTSRTAKPTTRKPTS